MSKNTYNGIDPEIVKIVKKTAAKAIGKSGFNSSDLADIEQELMIAALEARKQFHNDTGNETALIARIVMNRLKSIFRGQNRKSRQWRKCCFSLNIPVELDNGDTDELINLIDNEHLLRNDSFSFSCPYCNLDLRGNLNLAILRFPENLRELCEDLKCSSIRELAKEKNASSRSLRQEIKKIRKLLKKHESFILFSL
jgi:DNA-directed RNA polymerase specialized sigma24 family protein